MRVLFRWVIAAALGLAVMAGATAEAQQTGALTASCAMPRAACSPG